MSNGRRRGGFGLFLLASQIMNVGIFNIPPVTLVTIAMHVAIFLQLGDLDRWFYSAHHVCISSYKVLDRQQWSVLVLGALYHADDIHLYYNMASFLWKGRKLEKKFKSFYFAYLLIIFIVLTSTMYVLLNTTLSYLSDDRSYHNTCAVGFSGVIFALKVLTTHYSPPGIQYLLGFIPIPSKMIFWAELVLIQLITPHASFTGHLAGILVGLLYVKGPLKILMDSVFAPEPHYTYTANTTGYRNDSYRRTDNRTPTYSYSGYSGNSASSSPPPSAPAYDRYTGGMSEEEQMQQAMQNSLQQIIWWRPVFSGGGENLVTMYPGRDQQPSSSILANFLTNQPRFKWDSNLR